MTSETTYAASFQAVMVVIHAERWRWHGKSGVGLLFPSPTVVHHMFLIVNI